MELCRREIIRKRTKHVVRVGGRARIDSTIGREEGGRAEAYKKGRRRDEGLNKTGGGRVLRKRRRGG